MMKNYTVAGTREEGSGLPSWLDGFKSSVAALETLNEWGSDHIIVQQALLEPATRLRERDPRGRTE